MPQALDVLFPLPVPPFRFLAPLGEAAGPVGARVAAPWQGTVRLGLVVGREEVPATLAGQYREVIAWLDSSSYLAPGAAELLLELSEKSGAPAGLVLATMVPVGLREDLIHEVRLLEGVESLALPEGEWLPAESLGTTELDLYRQQGLIRERVRAAEQTVTRLVSLRPEDDRLEGASRANQRLALARLQETDGAESAAELAREADVPVSAVRSLVRKGYAGYAELPAPPVALPAPQPSDPPLQPIGAGSGDAPTTGPSGTAPAVTASLVTVVTGGLRADRLAAVLPDLQADLAAGNSALVLAPEAAYQAQAASLLASRVPVLTLTGELNDRQRMRVWEEAASGRPLVLVGTFAALLAPLPRLARIVVTEAGSASYKLAAGPRLFVPWAARRLAERRRVPLVLCDTLASPEMQLWASEFERTTDPTGATPPRWAGEEQSFGPVPGESRYLALPHVRQRLFVSDLSTARGWPVGSDLALVLRQVQERGRQAILLAPRRGFSAALACSECGHVVMCPNCDLALRYHRSGDRLRCYQCGHQAATPEACPSCASPSLAPSRAAGSEWVAGSVARLLPDIRVARLDSDRQDDLSDLRDGRPGVLVATTAVPRLPPLPRVSLIGITLLDTHLNLSDFRAAEESLRLLLQIPELAPGNRPLVVVQTFQPEHEALLALAHDDPEEAVRAYQRRIMERRQRFQYPPFGQLAKIQVSARDRAAAEREAARLAGSLLTAGASEEEVLGPVAAPISRVRGQYSFLVYLRVDETDRFRRLLRGVSQGSAGARVRLDVDPRDVAEFLE